MAKRIAILNSKGGVGKSTLAINLSRAFQLTGKRVLIADTDKTQTTCIKWRALPHETITYPTVLGFDTSDLDNQISSVDDAFDIVVIDGAGKLSAVDVSASIIAADLIIIPVQPSGPDIWEKQNLVEIILARQAITGGTPHARFMLSMGNSGRVLTRDIKEVLDQLGLPILESSVSYLEPYKQQITNGETVLELPDSAKAKNEVIAVSEEVTGILNG